MPEISSWESRNQILSARSDWEFNGRVGVSTETDGFDGKLRWIQHDEDFQVTVSGKLGIGAIRVEGDGQSVLLTDKNGVETRLENAEMELRARYGWTIPIESLRYWALGIPDPSEGSAGQVITTFNAELGFNTGSKSDEYAYAAVDSDANDRESVFHLSSDRKSTVNPTSSCSPFSNVNNRRDGSLDPGAVRGE